MSALSPDLRRGASLLFLVFLSLPLLLPAGHPPRQERPRIMVPHPDRLAQWIEEGTLPAHLRDPLFFQRKGLERPAERTFQPSGPINALAVVVEFSDHARTVTASFFDSLIFAPPVGGRGSVRDYYDEVSYGQVDIVTVDLPSSLGWQMAPLTYAYYVNGNYCFSSYPRNCQKLAEDIVDAINPLVDFAQYDADGDGIMEPIMLVHSGPGAEFTNNPNDIWSHSWMLAFPRFYDGVTIDRYVTMPEYWQTVSPVNSDMTIGVFCHEMGHGFWGLPDLYDYGYDSNGVGDWSLMSYGSWNGPNSGGWGSDGSSPAWPDAWCRRKMGFDSVVHILNPLSAVFLPVEGNQNAIGYMKSGTLNTQEYFLLENRQQILGTYDEYLPGSGLLIWHVDDMVATNNNQCTMIPHCWGACSSTHYHVALEQADGLDDLEFNVNPGDPGDPFPGSTGRTFWQPYLMNPGINPESGSWYDSGCTLDSCIDLTNIACQPLGNCMAQINRALCPGDEATADLGDAPAGQNSLGLTMTAYFPVGPLPWVPARFPTVYLPAPNVPGPRHMSPSADAWLGRTVSGERQADWQPDQDGPTNISPTLDLADVDSVASWPFVDDGLLLPVPLTPCRSSTFPFTLTVATGRPTMNRLVNAWFDWNRDGDWGDLLLCPDGSPVPEWSVQDMVTQLGPGSHPLVSTPLVPVITVWPDLPFEAWMRLSVAEAPAPVPQDGRGPVQQYAYGETEDYPLFLEAILFKSANLDHDPVPGERVTYRIELQALGNILGGGAVISDVLPAGIEYVGSEPPGHYDPLARTVTWSTTLDPVIARSFSLTVRVTGAPGDTITNTALLFWGGNLWRNASFSFRVGEGCAPGDPTAAFTVTQPACVSATVSFTNLTTGTLPITYTWDLDGDGLTDSTAEHPTWHYTAAGLYTVTLTATNACSQSTYSRPLTVSQPLMGLAIAGPAGLLVGQEGLYTAQPTPPDATDPRYEWDNGLVGITATYSWSTPGQYTIALTGSNACSLLTATLDVVVTTECVSLTGVVISGPVDLEVQQAGTYLAQPQPPTATTPTYLWWNGDTAAQTVVSWTLPGLYTVAVTATNCQTVVVTDTLRVLVRPAEGQWQVYLPLVFKSP